MHTLLEKGGCAREVALVGAGEARNCRVHRGALGMSWTVAWPLSAVVRHCLLAHHWGHRRCTMPSPSASTPPTTCVLPTLCGRCRCTMLTISASTPSTRFPTQASRRIRQAPSRRRLRHRQQQRQALQHLLLYKRKYDRHTLSTAATSGSCSISCCRRAYSTCRCGHANDKQQRTL